MVRESEVFGNAASVYDEEGIFEMSPEVRKSDTDVQPRHALINAQKNIEVNIVDDGTPIIAIEEDPDRTL